MIFSLALLAMLARSDPSIPMGEVRMAAAPAGAPIAVAPTTASEAAAKDSALRFLAMLDRDEWTACWQSTHTSFQLLNTVEWWAQTSQAVRARVGRPISRELATVDFTPAPPNGYWVITFKARYSNKSSVIETLQLASEKDGWKVAGITLE